MTSTLIDSESDIHSDIDYDFDSDHAFVSNLTMTSIPKLNLCPIVLLIVFNVNSAIVYVLKCDFESDSKFELDSGF